MLLWISLLSSYSFFFAGFGVFGIIVYIGEINIHPLGPSDEVLSIIYLVLIVVIGLVGGVLFLIFWRVGLFAVGGLGGFFGAMYVLALLPSSVLPQPLFRALIIVVATVICAFLVLKFERPMVIIATAITGAFLAILGLDFFVQTQFAASLAAILSSSGQYSPTGATYGMMAGVAVMAVIGMIIQFTLFKGLFRRDKSAANTSNRADNV